MKPRGLGSNGRSSRLWRRSLASPPALRQHAKGTRLRAVPPSGGQTEGACTTIRGRGSPPPASGGAWRFAWCRSRRHSASGDDRARPDRPTRGSARSSGRSTTTDCSDVPIEGPDPVNRCAALAEPVPQSLRQQELVCLTSGHVNCPRYLRGSMGTPEALERVRASRTLTPATVGALSLFVLAFALSLAFVVAQWGAGPDRGRTDADRRRQRPRARWRPQPPATPRRTPTPTPTATSEPTPSPSASPSPTRQPDHHAEPQPEPDPHARPDAEADPEAAVGGQREPARAAEAVPGHAGLLRLRRSLGRQPVQHRQLLRRVVDQGQGDEPVGQQRPDHRPRTPDPAADPLGSRPLAGPRDRLAAARSPERRVRPGVQPPRHRRPRRSAPSESPDPRPPIPS